MAKGTKVDGWLDRKAAAEYIGLTDWWLDKHAHTGKGPRSIIHGRKSWYRKTDLDAWREDQQKVAATGAGGVATLDNIWQAGQRRPPSSPPLRSELENTYAEEHGEPLASNAERKRRWKKLTDTFTAKQRILFADFKEA